MKKSTANKLNMYESVHSVLNDYQTSWQTIPAFVNSVNSFNTKLDQLRTRLVEKLGATTGVSLEKKLRTEDLHNRMLPVQHALFLLGRSSGDLTLRERNKRTKTNLRLMTLNEFATRCAELKGDIDSYGSQLTEFGITQQNLDELIPLLLGIDELNNSTRKAIIKRKGITQSIANLEQQLNEVLRVELDRLILVFRESVPAFFQSFLNARIIIDYKGGRGSRIE